MEAALERLLEGFSSFRSPGLGERTERFAELASRGQHPNVLLIGCSDSRIDPALLTCAQPGDLFIVRNVAAIVPPFDTDRRHDGTSSAIEFAVRGLEVRHIVVLGHEMCAGVRALAHPGGGYDFLGAWVELMAEVRTEVDARHLAPAIRQRALELGCILQSLKNLTTFPWIRSRVQAGTLKLHGWYFDLHERQLLAFDTETGQFASVGSRAAILATGTTVRQSCGPNCACSALPASLTGRYA